MTTDPDVLIHGYLDDELGDASLRQLNEWLVQDPANARRFASLALLNDRLHDQFQSDSAWNIECPVDPASSPPSRVKRWGRRALISACAATVVVTGLLGLQLATSRGTLAAEAELERLIAVSGQAVDRTYRIVSLNKPRRGLSPRRGP